MNQQMFKDQYQGLVSSTITTTSWWPCYYYYQPYSSHHVQNSSSTIQQQQQRPPVASSALIQRPFSNRRSPPIQSHQHRRHQQQQHRHRYYENVGKTSLCVNYMRRNRCPRQDECPYAHGTQQLDKFRTKHYYKIRWCPNGKYCRLENCPDLHSHAEGVWAQIYICDFDGNIKEMFK